MMALKNSICNHANKLALRKSHKYDYSGLTQSQTGRKSKKTVDLDLSNEGGFRPLNPRVQFSANQEDHVILNYPAAM